MTAKVVGDASCSLLHFTNSFAVLFNSAYFGIGLVLLKTTFSYVTVSVKCY